VKTVTKMATRLTRLGRQRAVSLLLVILMVSLNGAQGHSGLVQFAAEHAGHAQRYVVGSLNRQ
jgi:hypothetical protein